MDILYTFHFCLIAEDTGVFLSLKKINSCNPLKTYHPNQRDSYINMSGGVCLLA